MKFRIMYLEDKSKGLNGPARIGRVRLSKTGETLYYAGRTFEALRNSGLKANFRDVETGQPFWIAKARKAGDDRLYKGAGDPPSSPAKAVRARSCSTGSHPGGQTIETRCPECWSASNMPRM